MNKFFRFIRDIGLALLFLLSASAVGYYVDWALVWRLLWNGALIFLLVLLAGGFILSVFNTGQRAFWRK